MGHAPYVAQPQTLLFASSNTGNKIRPFIKKLKNVDFPFFPMKRRLCETGCGNDHGARAHQHRAQVAAVLHDARLLAAGGPHELELLGAGHEHDAAAAGGRI